MVSTLTKDPSPRRRRFRGLGVKKRHLYLTDDVYEGLLVQLATAAGTSPSDVCEQILRHHQTALALPQTPETYYGLSDCREGSNHP